MSWTATLIVDGLRGVDAEVAVYGGEDAFDANRSGGRSPAEVDGRRQAVVRSQATMCDLCHDIVGPHEEVSCVYACPHNAAFRMSGSELLAKVKGYKPV